MTSNDIRSIALFFFFAFADDRMAVPAAIQALSLARNFKKKNPDLPSEVAVIKATARVWGKQHTRQEPGLLRLGTSPGWTLPPKIDMAPWREFQKSASTDELAAVIWSKVLNYDDALIGRALGLSGGTVSYRLGHALKKLGESLRHPRLL